MLLWAGGTVAAILHLMIEQNWMFSRIKTPCKALVKARSAVKRSSGSSQSRPILGRRKYKCTALIDFDWKLTYRASIRHVKCFCPHRKMDSEFSPELLEIAQRVYDEHRYYIPCAPGMVNQIYRNGFLPKKTIDKDHHIRMQSSENYYREYEDTMLSCQPAK